MRRRNEKSKSHALSVEKSLTTKRLSKFVKVPRQWLRHVDIFLKRATKKIIIDVNFLISYLLIKAIMSITLIVVGFHMCQKGFWFVMDNLDFCQVRMIIDVKNFWMCGAMYGW